MLQVSALVQNLRVEICFEDKTEECEIYFKLDLVLCLLLYSLLHYIPIV